MNLVIKVITVIFVAVLLSLCLMVITLIVLGLFAPQIIQNVLPIGFLSTILIAAFVLFLNFSKLEAYLHRRLDELEANEEKHTPNVRIAEPKRSSPYLRLPRRAHILGLGMTLISLGGGLLTQIWAGASFIGAFFLVTGIQVSLWAIGIRLEILSNRSS
jgi:hypothetical protein